MIKIFIYGLPLKKDSVSAQARAEYIKRLSRIAKVTFKRLPSVLPEGCINFSDSGAAISSPDLAQFLALNLKSGNELHLALNGASSACPESIQLTSLPLSAETESVLLLEQIYRAFKIMAGEPYHK